MKMSVIIIENNKELALVRIGHLSMADSHYVTNRPLVFN